MREINPNELIAYLAHNDAESTERELRLLGINRNAADFTKKNLTCKLAKSFYHWHTKHPKSVDQTNTDTYFSPLLQWLASSDCDFDEKRLLVVTCWRDYYAAHLNGAADTAGLVPLAKELFYEPEKLLGFLWFLSNSGMTPRQIIEAGVLHDFFNTVFAQSGADDSELTVFYQLMAAFSETPTLSTLRSLAAHVSCNNDKLTPDSSKCRVLDGTLASAEKTENIPPIPEKKATKLKLTDQLTITTLETLFGLSFIYQADLEEDDTAIFYQYILDNPKQNISKLVQILRFHNIYQEHFLIIANSIVLYFENNPDELADALNNMPLLITGFMLSEKIKQRPDFIELLKKALAKLTLGEVTTSGKPYIVALNDMYVHLAKAADLIPAEIITNLELHLFALIMALDLNTIDEYLLNAFKKLPHLQTLATEKLNQIYKELIDLVDTADTMIDIELQWLALRKSIMFLEENCQLTTSPVIKFPQNKHHLKAFYIQRKWETHAIDKPFDLSQTLNMTLSVQADTPEKIAAENERALLESLFFIAADQTALLTTIISHLSPGWHLKKIGTSKTIFEIAIEKRHHFILTTITQQNPNYINQYFHSLGIQEVEKIISIENNDFLIDQLNKGIFDTEALDKIFDAAANINSTAVLQWFYQHHEQRYFSLEYLVKTVKRSSKSITQYSNYYEPLLAKFQTLKPTTEEITLLNTIVDDLIAIYKVLINDQNWQLSENTAAILEHLSLTENQITILLNIATTSKRTDDIQRWLAYTASHLTPEQVKEALLAIELLKCTDENFLAIIHAIKEQETLDSMLVRCVASRQYTKVSMILSLSSESTVSTQGIHQAIIYAAENMIHQEQLLTTFLNSAHHISANTLSEYLYTICNNTRNFNVLHLTTHLATFFTVLPKNAVIDINVIKELSHKWQKRSAFTKPKAILAVYATITILDCWQDQAVCNFWKEAIEEFKKITSFYNELAELIKKHIDNTQQNTAFFAAAPCTRVANRLAKTFVHNTMEEFNAMDYDSMMANDPRDDVDESSTLAATT